MSLRYSGLTLITLKLTTDFPRWNYGTNRRSVGVDPDPVAELSQSLKAAGVHPSQLAPVILEKTTPDVTHSAVVEVPDKPQPGRFVRWLDKTLCRVLDPLTNRTWEDRLRD